MSNKDNGPIGPLWAAVPSDRASIVAYLRAWADAQPAHLYEMASIRADVARDLADHIERGDDRVKEV